MNTLAAGVYAREAGAELRKVFRSPQFLVPTIVLPVGSFAMSASFGAAGRPHALEGMVAAFSVMAALGPALLGFGSGIALEREAGLLDLKRVSPLPATGYLVAKLAACMTTAALSVCAILAIAAMHGMAISWWRWPIVVVVASASSIPFTLVGMTVGLRVTTQAATAIANALLIGFTAAGGLLIPIAALPGWLAPISEGLPVIHFGRLTMLILGSPGVVFGMADLIAVSIFCLIFGWLSLIGWQRSVA